MDDASCGFCDGAVIGVGAWDREGSAIHRERAAAIDRHGVHGGCRGGERVGASSCELENVVDGRTYVLCARTCVFHRACVGVECSAIGDTASKVDGACSAMDGSYVCYI